MKIKDFIKSLKPKPCYNFTVYLKNGKSVTIPFDVGTWLIESLLDPSNLKIDFKFEGSYCYFFNLSAIECVVRQEVEHNFGG